MGQYYHSRLVLYTIERAQHDNNGIAIVFRTNPVSGQAGENFARLQNKKVAEGMPPLTRRGISGVLFKCSVRLCDSRLKNHTLHAAHTYMGPL